jgi:hypothetical protein
LAAASPPTSALHVMTGNSRPRDGVLSHAYAGPDKLL